ncbi:leucine rich repeat protein [Anaeramoeba ignava]|uniref:Leucine rich repeat protein n=1 Tax=Anaeramoeba ignava TaxID=1746090 RepID=A0A9Q0RDB2_ANAIG|nr:leucine rich repeat protein [Anaeramoeba ignava]
MKSNSNSFERNQLSSDLSIIEEKEIEKEIEIPNQTQKIDNINFEQSKLYKLPELKQNSQKIQVQNPFEKQNQDIHKGMKPTIQINIDKNMISFEEPAFGLEPLGFDIQKYNQERKNRSFLHFVPDFFSDDSSPLRFEEDIPKEEKLTNPNKINQANSKIISCISFVNLPLGQMQSASLLNQINQFNALEILILQNCGIESLSFLTHLELLRICDLQNNQISRIKNTIIFLKKSPKIEILDLSGNPICKREEWKYIIIANTPRIFSLNGDEVSIDQKMESIKKYGTKEIKRYFEIIRWEYALLSIPEIRVSPGWYPQNIVKLNLPNQQLTEIHIGSLTSLQYLNLRKNLLTSLNGSGIENCAKLTTINLNHNKLKKNIFRVLPFCPSLQNLRLMGNKLKDNYRLHIIYHCRNLKGSNHQPGLLTLDKKNVTMEEYLESLYKIGNFHQFEVSMIRWNLTQIKEFGHYQLRNIPNFTSQIQEMKIQNDLSFISVGKFPSLKVLVLSNNQIINVQGLDELKHLQLLDLSGNPQLQLSSVLRQLQKSHELISVSFAFDREIPQPSKKKKKKNTQYLSVHNQNYRIQVVGSLLIHHPQLSTLDYSIIRFDERIDALSKYHHKNYDKKGVEQYRFSLAIMMKAIPFDQQQFSPEKVKKISNEIQVSEITEIECFKDLGLSNTGTNFNSFVNLEKLNISNNRIKQLVKIGLNGLPNLRILDAKNNLIADSLLKIGELIDSLKNLEMIFLSGNPCMKQRKSRIKLLSSIQCLREVKCRLQVLDYPIELKERIEAWKYSGAPEKDLETLRIESAMFLRTPQNMELNQITELDLSFSQLSSVDISEFVQLEIFLFHNNILQTAKSIFGIEAARDTLRVLDLRNNKLSDMTEIVELTQSLPKLISLGLLGNKFSSKTNTKYRPKMIDHLKQLRNVHSPLRELDGIEITIDEIAQSWDLYTQQKINKNANFADFEEFRFVATVFRRIPQITKDDKMKIEEIDLSSSKLIKIDFSSLSMLKKISLQGNKLTENSLTNSKLDTLQNLEELDLSWNLFKHLKFVCGYLNGISSLISIFILGNPCYLNETKESRIQFFRFFPSVFTTKSALQKLNGNEIEIKEICSGLTEYSRKKNRAYGNLENNRLSLIVYRKQILENSQILDFADFGFSNLFGIQQFTSNLIKLDLSNNKLINLDGIQNLNNLQELNLRNNEFSSLEFIIHFLVPLVQLRKLFLKQSTKEKSKTSDPHKYLEFVCSQIAVLDSVDDLKNPFPLDPRYLFVCKKLEEMTNGMIGNPNQISDIDVSNKQLDSDLFQPILNLLSQLPIVDLKMYGNYWESIPNYRFIVINAIPTLQSLDGVVISLSQRAYALELEEKGTIDKFVGVGIAIDNIVMNFPQYIRKAQEENLQDQTETNQTANLQYAIPQQKKDIKFPGTNRDGFSLNATGKVLKSSFLQPKGKFINKLEIVINFLQFVGLFVSSISEKYWPESFKNVSLIVFPFDIDFNYLMIVFGVDMSFSLQTANFIIFMVIPILILLLYFWRFNKSKWIRIYVENWKKTKFFIFLIWFCLSIISIAICIFAIPPAFISQSKSLTTFQRSMMIFCITFITLIAVIFFINAIIFRKKYTKEKYWYSLVKYKQRVTLFLLTIFYLPLIRIILYNFKCDDDHKKLILRPDENCPNSIKSFSAIQWLSLIFGFIYVFGIPLFFIFTIRKVVKEIDNSFGISNDLKEISQMQKKSKKLNQKEKEEIKKKKKQTEKKYIIAARKYKCAQSYLYSPYKRKYRYFKVIQMMEKFLILLLTVLPFEVTILISITFSIIVFFALVAIFAHPWSDNLEHFMDIVFRLNNSIILFIALLIVTDKLKPDSLLSALFLLLSCFICFSFLLLSLFYSPLRVCIFKSKQKKLKNQEKKEMNQFMDSLVHFPKNSSQIQIDGIELSDLDLESNSQNSIQNHSNFQKENNQMFHSQKSLHHSNRNPKTRSNYSNAFHSLQIEGVDLDKIDDISLENSENSENSENDLENKLNHLKKSSNYTFLKLSGVLKSKVSYSNLLRSRKSVDFLKQTK